MDSVEEQVIKIIAKLAQKDPSKITMDKKLFEELNIDSLRGLELLSRISQKFDITVPDDALIEIHTVGDIIKMINEHLKTN